jgi:hypothetical protein
MPLSNQTLRPGLLVVFKSSLTGNISYLKREIKAEEVKDDRSAEATWETTRVIANRDEHERGRKAQAEARSVVAKVCTLTAFGLLCPEADAEKLEKALKEAREIGRVFNESAQVARLQINMLCGKIAADDVEAVKAINSEVRDLMKTMEEGVRNADVTVIRKAANEAKRLGSMLSVEAAGRVQVAIDAVRSAAREIVKAGDAAVIEVDRSALARLEECRMAFLDLDEQREVAAPQMEGRTVDMEPPLPFSQIEDANEWRETDAV